MSGRLALGLAGAVIGAFFAQPALGWTLGTLVGSLAFPPEGNNTESRNLEARLQDSAVTKGVNGSARQLSYGTIRQAGEIIWHRPLEIEAFETTTTTGGGGGKGGGGGGSHSQTDQSFTYHRSFAVGFGTGPVNDITKMFFDGNLVLDRSGTQDDVIMEGLSYRFYPGNEEQLPDPLVIEQQTAARSPAFRGTPYVMIDRLDVKNLGGRAPNVTAVLTSQSAPARLVNLGENLPDSMFSTFLTNSIAVDWLRNRAYLFSNTEGSGIRRFDIRTMTENYQVLLEDALDLAVLDPVPPVGLYFYCAPDGSLIFNIGLNNSRIVVRLDGNSLRETSRFGEINGSLGMSPTRFETAYQFWSISCLGLNGILTAICVGGQFSSVGVLGPLPDLIWLSDTDTYAVGASAFGVFKGGCTGAIGPGEGRGYFLMGPTYATPSSGNLGLFRIVIFPSFDLLGNETLGVDISHIHTFTPSDLLDGAVTLGRAGQGLMYDSIDDSIIFGASGPALTTHSLIKFDPNDKVIVWKTSTLYSWNDPRVGDSRLVNSSLGWINDAGRGIFLNTATGEVLENFVEPPWTPPPSIGALGYYDSRNESFLTTTQFPGKLARYYFNRIAAAETSLAVIVLDICKRVRIPEERIEVIDLLDIIVPGYLLHRQVTGVQALAPLLQFYQIDVVESDFKLKFKKRSGIPQDTIRLSDMKYQEVSGKPSNRLVPSSKIKDTDLPVKYNITYLDPNQDYNQDTQQAKRIRFPISSMKSDNPQGFSISAALDPTEVKKQAEKLLFTEWNERDPYEIEVHWGKLALDPGDSVNLELFQGQLAQARITSASLGANLTYKLKLLGEHPAQYDTAVTFAQSGEGFIAPVIAATNLVRLFLLDTPLLRDTDEPPGRAYAPLYYAMSGYEEGQFERGILYRSAEGNTFEEVATIINPAKWGTTTTALADPIEVFQTHETSLTVLMSVGEPAIASISQSDLLETANNAAIIVKTNGEVEIVQFRDVAQNPDGSLTLTGFLRGKRGTDTMAYGHTANETFILLEASVGSTTPIPTAELGTPKYYKAVGLHQAFADAQTQAITSTGRALKPWSPVQQKATLSGGDVILTWNRRTRIGGVLRDGVSTVPLNEDTEVYDVLILASPGGATIRTYADITTPTVTYTAAEQAADSYTNTNPLTFVVYQKSAQVGRGFGREVTITPG